MFRSDIFKSYQDYIKQDTDLSLQKLLGKVSKRIAVDYDKEGNTLLHNAISDGKTNLAEALIVRYQFGVNKPNKRGTLPLHLATRVGNVLIVELLLKHGADVNAQERDTLDTALHIALKQPDISCELIKLLHGKGAKYELKNRCNETVASLARAWQCNGDPANPTLKQIVEFMQHMGNKVCHLEKEQISQGEQMKEVTRKQAEQATQITNFETRVARVEEKTVEKFDILAQMEIDGKREMRELRGITTRLVRKWESSLPEFPQSPDQYVTCRPHDDPIYQSIDDLKAVPLKPHLKADGFTVDGDPPYDVPTSISDLLDQNDRDAMKRGTHTFVQNVKIKHLLTRFFSEDVITQLEFEALNQKKDNHHDLALDFYLSVMKGKKSTLKTVRQIFREDSQHEIASLFPDSDIIIIRL